MTRTNFEHALQAARSSYLQDAAPAELAHHSLALMRAAAWQAGAQPQTRTKPRRFALLAGSGALFACLGVALLAASGQAGAALQNATPFVYAQGEDKQSVISRVETLEMPRDRMLDFGFPVPAERMHESVRAELLVGTTGQVIGLRFIERPQPGAPTNAGANAVPAHTF